MSGSQNHGTIPLAAVAGNDAAHFSITCPVGTEHEVLHGCLEMNLTSATQNLLADGSDDFREPVGAEVRMRSGKDACVGPELT